METEKQTFEKYNIAQMIKKSEDGNTIHCTLSDSELVEKCKTWICELYKTRGRAWRVSIPIEFNQDPDILFDELIQRFQNYLNEPE